MTEQQNKLSGFLYIDKPKDWTSFDVVNKLRALTCVRKIGHAGTLDPAATGLLIVAVGKNATKQISQYVKLNKEYEAQITLGYISDTYDSEGILTKVSSQKPSLKKIEKSVSQFRGEIWQTPPIFSAKKVQGVPLYKLARQGKSVQIKPQKIFIENVTLLDYQYPLLKIKVQCSCGTYIRSLAADLGLSLKTGAYLSKLKRTKIGAISVRQAVKIKDITKDNWLNFLIKTANN